MPIERLENIEVRIHTFIHAGVIVGLLMKEFMAL